MEHMLCPMCWSMCVYCLHTQESWHTCKSSTAILGTKHFDTSMRSLRVIANHVSLASGTHPSCQGPSIALYCQGGVDPFSCSVLHKFSLTAKGHSLTLIKCTMFTSQTTISYLWHWHTGNLILLKTKNKIVISGCVEMVWHFDNSSYCVGTCRLHAVVSRFKSHCPWHVKLSARHTASWERKARGSMLWIQYNCSTWCLCT